MKIWKQYVDVFLIFPFSLCSDSPFGCDVTKDNCTKSVLISGPTADQMLSMKASMGPTVGDQAEMS